MKQRRLRLLVALGAMLGLMLVNAAPAFAQDDLDDYDVPDYDRHEADYLHLGSDVDFEDAYPDETMSLNQIERNAGLDIDIGIDPDGNRVVVITDDLSGAQVVANIPSPPPPSL